MLILDRVHGANAVVGAVDAGLPMIERVVDGGIAVAKAPRISATLNKQTLEFLRTQPQMGLPLTEFQVLQHWMVDMFASCELLKSTAYMAAVRAGDNDAGARAKAVSAA